MKLWLKILIALALGVATGLIWGPQAEILKPIGGVFLSLINMIIMLLVLASMTVGITSIHDPKKLGRVGLKSLMVFLSTTMAAIVMGLLFSQIFQVGGGLNLKQSKEIVLETPPGLSEILLSIVPSNPIQSLVEGNVLQVIVFALFLGISINFAGQKGKPLLEFMESLADVMYRMTSIVMEFSPIGVFAIMASVAGSFGIAVLIPLIKFLLAYYTAAIVHCLIIFCSILWFMAKLSPLPFFKGMSDAIMVAFSTSSSSASLPVSMHCVQENLGVSKNISNFVLPLGSTVNMNGAAIFQGMAAVFISRAYGIDLDWQSLLTLTVTSTLSAIGAAGIPGSGFIMLTVVFSSIGLPIEGLAILAGIDRMREMGSTVLNILGDAVCAVYVAKREGELDERQYYHEELVELEGSDI
ncbi:dicarboxylate/amino acid:cation symporter [Parachlamydia sp. AcF125]|uniref:dicarboxylate/amino acid:cation symporter n=1 Tax=Parachlamydia sp. AcF125 TaxID=2795736 RepID=UPI001BC96F67|nr:dicarboxylate/amino acid:cation symporter [Parachlamydia sp. AcF125]MBS4167701.1 Proton/sodium-glutamate symport protein [Parachlamydia sp. AcF125]